MKTIFRVYWVAFSILAVSMGLHPATGGEVEVENIPPRIIGRVVEGRLLSASTNAVVLVYRNGRLVSGVHPDTNGDFRVETPLPPKEPPSWRNMPYTLIARMPDMVPPVAPMIKQVQPSATPVQFELPADVPLRIRVTDTKGAPLSNAVVSVTRIWLPNPNGRGDGPFLVWKDYGAVGVNSGITDTEGATTLSNLPQNVTARLLIHKDGLADNVATIDTPETEVRSVQLSQETIIEGTIKLGDEPLKGVQKWRMKTQSWSRPWTEAILWRTSQFDANGHYEIRNIPSLEIIGERNYGINLDLDLGANPAEGITGTYVPPKAGYDVLATIKRDGKIERWICYVEAGRNGLTYAEGERVHHDIHLEPMAVIKGTLKPPPEMPVRISYRNPKSIYGDWRVQSAADGSFEIPVPTGDVTLKIGAEQVPVKDLKPQEERALTYP